MRDWVLGTQRQVGDDGRAVGRLVRHPGRTSSTACPVTTENGEYKLVEGLSIDAFSQQRMDVTLKELLEERDGVKHLL